MLPNRWINYTPDGKLSGAYVYMLLCCDGEDIYVKVGMTISPLRRFAEIRHGCPVTPRQFMTCHVRGREIALKLEAEILERSKKWRAHGEWLKMTKADKEEFNQAIRLALLVYSRNGWMLKWDRLNVAELVLRMKQRAAHFRLRYKQTVFGDFVRHGGLAKSEQQTL